MTIRVGINGSGRIGRDMLHNVTDRGDAGVEVVAVNDIMPAARSCRRHGRCPQGNREPPRRVT
jgi:glyceraldehyde-3-phosphate dehydrogenase/erythrose-4-phosphate dehydrogenase